MPVPEGSCLSRTYAVLPSLPRACSLNVKLVPRPVLQAGPAWRLVWVEQMTRRGWGEDSGKDSGGLWGPGDRGTPGWSCCLWGHLHSQDQREHWCCQGTPKRDWPSGNLALFHLFSAHAGDSLWSDPTRSRKTRSLLQEPLSNWSNLFPIDGLRSASVFPALA